jgi:hypothetical protein
MTRLPKEVQQPVPHTPRAHPIADHCAVKIPAPYIPQAPYLARIPAQIMPRPVSTSPMLQKRHPRHPAPFHHTKLPRALLLLLSASPRPTITAPRHLACSHPAPLSWPRAPQRTMHPHLQVCPPLLPLLHICPVSRRLGIVTVRPGRRTASKTAVQWTVRRRYGGTTSLATLDGTGRWTGRPSTVDGRSVSR